MIKLDPEKQYWALLDCDDVLLDWIGGFGKFITGLTGRKISGRPDSWDLAAWLGIHQDEVRKHIDFFNEHDIGFESLTRMKGSAEGLRTLKKFGFKTAIITSSSVHPSSVERRARNVGAAFGDLIDRLHIVPLGESKEAVLRSYSNAIWVEDNPNNAIMGNNLGHLTYLMKQAHNRTLYDAPETGITPVENWDALTPLIISRVPDAQQRLGLRDNSIAALIAASERANHSFWTPKNPETEVMKRLVDMGVVSLRKHPRRRPTAELTDVGLAVFDIDAPKVDNDFSMDVEI